MQSLLRHAIVRRTIAFYLSPTPSLKRFATTKIPIDKLVLAARKTIEASNDAEFGAETNKRKREIEEIQRALQEVLNGEELIATLNELSTDPDEELRLLAESDLPEAQETLVSLRKSLLSLLLPPTAVTNFSALLEIKSGVGGSESSLFAAELVRMYSKMSVRKGWKADLVEAIGISGVGGSAEAYREAILEIKGIGAFGTLRREAGVHRVQRVPATESQGRVHTSTVGIIVLPVDNGDNDKGEELLFEQKDVKVEVMRSRGAGGQHVNKTESAIRLTHIPTGISVSMQDSRSQHENRTKAYKVLRARLMDRRLNLEMEARRSTRLKQVKGADRSEKIRTYNFPQDRITDHRIPLTVSGLSDAMEGGDTIDMISRELEIKEQEEILDSILS